MAAPIGNQNAAKSRRFEQALERAIAQDDGKRLRKAAEQLLDLAAAGEAWAVKELRDTLDGKPKQQTELTGAEGGPIKTVSRIELVAMSGNSKD